MYFWCREDYGIVYLLGRCTGGGAGKVLSASGFLDVYSSGDNEWDSGIFRGMGDLKVTLYSTFMNMAGRVLAVIVMFLVFHFGFVSLAWANLIGWIIDASFEISSSDETVKKELRK